MRAEDRIATWLIWFPQVAGGCVAAVGALALIGWLFDVAPLRAALPGVVPIQPGIALFFVCAGPALALLAPREVTRRRRVLGLACAGAAAAWGAVHLIEFVSAAAFGRDELVFEDLASLTRLPLQGSASGWAALLFGMLGCAPFLLNTRRIHWFAELLIVAPLSISFLGLVAEVFRFTTTAGSGAERPSAIPTVLAFLLLELGLLFARPDRGWMGILTGDSLGGALARRLLPFAVLVPFGTAWVRVLAEQAGLPSALGGILHALAIIFVQSVLILWYAAAVNRTDRERKEAEEFVRTLLRVGARLNSTLDVDSLMDILVAEAIRLADAESGLSGLRTGEGMACRRYVLDGQPVPFDRTWPAGHGLPGWVAEHKAPCRTNDAGADPRMDQGLVARFDVRSALATPILDSRGEVLGFFEVHNSKEGGFTEGDQGRLLAVAQTAASAIQNALAYRHLREAEQALQAADRYKNEFLATLAHELRNPLAPLCNGLQVLRMAGQGRESFEQARAMMERQLGQMVRLIDDLLDLSRISRGRIELRKKRVELSAAVQQAVETSRPAIDQAGHRLTVRLPLEPIHVDADLTRLAQVFANLLNNAAKFTEPGGDLRLTVERQADEAVVTVRDDGVGIPPAMLARVFDMFTQVDRSLERSRGGLGIGLSLVKTLVQMHGGSVEARSEGTGTGSEFVVRLPAVAPPAEEPPDDDGEVRRPARRRVLVVDDNRDVATSLAMMLDMMGNETRTAHDGLAALEVGADFLPEVVLLDIGMPKLNGYDTARRIRQEPWGRAMTLIALTGWGQEEDRRRSREAGFDHHAVKPVELTTLEKLLGASHAVAACSPS